jgi:ATP-dependent DNA helicase PIF1
MESLFTRQALVRLSTIHSFAGVQTGNDELPLLKEYASRGKSRANWLDTEVLIIDEISMISALLFDRLSEVGKHVRSSVRPFGGIRLIMFGDFLQLPPVAPRRNARAKKGF